MANCTKLHPNVSRAPRWVYSTGEDLRAQSHCARDADDAQFNGQRLAEAEATHLIAVGTHHNRKVRAVGLMQL